jgi:hypothetical protein
MKFDKHVMRFVIVALVIASIAVVVMFSMRKKPSTGTKKGSEWTVYGTHSCGWTKKQLENMDSKGVPYTFVDCSNGNCDGISGYPTLKSSDGTVKVGYTPM